MCKHLERIEWEKWQQSILRRFDKERWKKVEWVAWITLEELRSACGMWRGPKVMSNSTAGSSWKTSWWSWYCGRTSPAAATVNLIQTEQILMRHKLGLTHAQMEHKLYKVIALQNKMLILNTILKTNSYINIFYFDIKCYQIISWIIRKNLIELSDEILLIILINKLKQNKFLLYEYDESIINHRIW